MKLITKALEKRFIEVGQQIHSDDPLVICKLFTPWTYRTWYVTEYYPDDKVCYGYVEWDSSERWYFALPELESLKWPYGLCIERDLYFNESLFSSLKLQQCQR